MSGEYKYTTLPSGAIRVLELDYDEDLTAPLKGILRTISLAGANHTQSLERNDSSEIGIVEIPTRPCYIALPYAWGTEQHMQSLMCNGKTIPIRDDLYRALIRIRQQFVKAQNLVEHDQAAGTAIHPWANHPCLWIDAICINQTDLEECSSQVQQMHSIYASAASLLIWLGEADAEPPVNMDFYRKYDILQSADGTPKIVEVLGDNSLFDRSWFKRRWIIQEVQSAPRHRRHVLIGDALVSSKMIHQSTTLSSMAGHMIPLQDSPRTPRSLLYGLLANFHTECSRPHDRIYALMHISSDTAWLRVDYRQPIEDLYRAVATHYVNEITTNPVALCGLLVSAVYTRAGNSDDRSTRPGLALPLWVPDWHRLASSPNRDWIVQSALSRPKEIQAVLNQEAYGTAPRWPCAHRPTLAAYGDQYLIYHGRVLKPDTPEHIKLIKMCFMGINPQPKIRRPYVAHESALFHVLLPGMTIGPIHQPVVLAFVIKKQEDEIEGMGVYALTDMVCLFRHSVEKFGVDLNAILVGLEQISVILC